LLFDDRPRNEDDGHVRLYRLRVLQRGDSVVARQVVVGDDEIEGFFRQRGFETVLGVYHEDVAGQTIDVQPVANHLGVARAILQVEHSKLTRHACSFRISHIARTTTLAADSAALR